MAQIWKVHVYRRRVPPSRVFLRPLGGVSVNADLKEGLHWPKSRHSALALMYALVA
jgi:hypothetical protein